MEIILINIKLLTLKEAKSIFENKSKGETNKAQISRPFAVVSNQLTFSVVFFNSELKTKNQAKKNIAKNCNISQNILSETFIISTGFEITKDDQTDQIITAINNFFIL